MWGWITELVTSLFTNRRGDFQVLVEKYRELIVELEVRFEKRIAFLQTEIDGLTGKMKLCEERCLEQRAEIQVLEAALNIKGKRR